MYPWPDWTTEQWREFIAEDKAWDPDKHPRNPAGASDGGRFASTGGGGGGGGGFEEGQRVVYHGTVDEFVASIREQGLTVSREEDRNYNERHYDGERGESVFVTTTLESAKSWAADSEILHNGGTPVVLKFTIPREDARRLKMDELAGDEVSLRYRGNIPPKYLDGYYRRDHFNREADAWEWKYERVRKAAEDVLTLYAAVLCSETASEPN